MKCSNCKCKVDKDKLIVSGIKYFCGNECMYLYLDKNINHHRMMGKSTLNKIGKRTKERLASEGSESLLFKQRYEQLVKQNRNYCMVTGKLITEDMLSPASFPHILPKSKYKALRYMKNNIGLVLGIEEHNKFDNIVNKYKDFYGLDKLKTDILCGKEVYLDILFFYKGLNYE